MKNLTKPELINNRENERLEKLGWSIQSVWNEMLDSTRSSEPKVRDYIIMSDLGKNYWDRYQKMNAVPETNPFPERILRIFAAGDEFHHLMKNVFKACGLFINTQDDLDKDGKTQWSIIPATKTHLKVLGKYDILAGGKPDYTLAKKHCEEWGFSDFVKERTLLMIKKLLERYPNGLRELLYEVKSINSMAFWNKKDYLIEAYPHNVLQCYGYLKANKKEEGRMLYVSKDDLMISEFPVYLKSEVLAKAFNKDVREMSGYILRKEEPPKPDYLVFNKRAKLRFQKDTKKHIINGCYEANWEVRRSRYLTLMTGCKDEEEFLRSIKGELSDKNEEIKDRYKKKYLK